MRKSNTIKNIMSTLLLQFVTIVCGFIVPKMIIEAFGSNVNGLVSSITQFLSYITFLEAGIGPVIKSLLYKPIADKNKQKIEAILKSAENFFRVISKIFIIYIIGLLIIYPLIVKDQFDVLYTASLILIISISTFMEYYIGMVYKLYLQAEQKKYIISETQIITTILNTIIIIILIKIGTNIQLVKLISTLIYVIRPIVLSVYVKKNYNINLKDVNKPAKIEQKWDGLAQHIASIIHTNTDVTVLTIFSKNISEVSVYSVYYMVVKGIRQVVDAFSTGVEDFFGSIIAKKEQKSLNEKFNLYELGYYSISTILYMCTLILIVPFVQVYTMGINDANYIRYAFAYLLVLGEFIWTIRQPYNNLVKVAGHFKQTKIGAWMEAVINIVLSVLLVFKLGIVGVAIGTLVALSIRTTELIIYTSKNILNRNLRIVIKRILVIVIQFVLFFIILNLTNLLNNVNINSYYEWIKYAIKIFIIALFVVIGTNSILYNADFKTMLKKIIRKPQV